MPSPVITVFIFIQANAATPVEKLVVEAQCAAALDTLKRLKSLHEIGDVIFSTNDSKFAVKATRLGGRAELDPEEEFNWGKQFAALIAKYHPSIPFYIGGGSGVLMGVQDWRDAIRAMRNNQPIVVTNNFFSCDFAAWYPTDALKRIQIPDIDNNLAFRLGDQAGLEVRTLPKSAATLLDIDTPTDLMTLHRHPGIGENLQKFLAANSPDTTRMQRVQKLFRQHDATLLLAGRVSGSMANLLEHATRCQWRIISEERGMRASGREERGEARSLFGELLQRVGAQEFIAQISGMAQGAIIDTRVLLAHLQLKTTLTDRFYSDLFQPENISNPLLRDLTTAARDAPIPILFGGHSLVSGGMYAMIETAFMV